MTPEELFRDPQVNRITVSFREVARGITHMINVVFHAPEITALNPTELEILIKSRVDKAKEQLSETIQKSKP